MECSSPILHRFQVAQVKLNPRKQPTFYWLCTMQVYLLESQVVILWAILETTLSLEIFDKEERIDLTWGSDGLSRCE